MHLVPDDILAEYACGATTPGVSLLVAAQLTHSPEGRRRVREYERLGGVLLAAEEGIAMAPGALDAAMARLGDAQEAVRPARPGAASGPLPLPVLDRLGVAFEEIVWKFRLPGISACDLDGFGDEKVQLFRARPGSSIPHHTHKGLEMTLVLQGCLEDAGVEYRKGDVAINDESDDHRPRILGDEICYCLIVQHGALHFTGTFARILNYLGQ